MAGKGTAPLNYTTTIDPHKSAGECVSMLALHGASAVAITYDDNQFPTGIVFQIKTELGVRQYSLPASVDGTAKAMHRAAARGRIPPRFDNREQARRVSWRVVKDWLEAQLAMIEAGLAELERVMLPWMHEDKRGTLHYDVWHENERMAIEAGGSDT